jgi:diaminopimelate decarboxylase
LASCFELTVQIAEELSELLDFPLEILNLGGGFPWPYSSAGEGPDLSPLREKLAELVASSGKAREAEWWFESGRFLSAASGTLVSRVMDLKVSKEEKEYLILDTGIHHLGGMAGLGRIPKFSIDLEIPASRQDNEEMTVDVVGQLCTPLDCIGRRIKMPRVEAGDLVAIPNTGAYGPTASVLGFLSRPAPTEILHRGGTVLAASRLRGGHDLLD